MTLADATPGRRLRVGAATVVDATIMRLLEMGLTDGVEVTVLRRAPFGDPLELDVRGTRLCVRRSDAANLPVVDLGA